MKKKSTILLACTGSFLEVNYPLHCSLENLKLAPQNHEIIFCLDGPEWLALPGIQNFINNQRAQVFVSPRETSLPAVILNGGLAMCSTEYFTVLAPGGQLRWPEYEQLIAELEQLNKEIACLFIHQKTAGGTNPLRFNYGELQLTNFVGLAGTLFSTRKVKEVGGFDESPLLQKWCDWDIILRLSKYNQIRRATINANMRAPELENLAYTKYYPAPFADRHAYLVSDRKAGLPPLTGGTRQKIVVTGGYWEPTHNQLAFFNYFETEQGKSDFWWRPVLDSKIRFEDLEGIDTLIICRSRDPHIISIIDYCNLKQIPTVYVIDDNWLTVAQEMPEYKDLFSPGSPDFETFLYCLKNCQHTLVHYSQTLANQIRPHCRNLVFFPRIGINLKDYAFEGDLKKERKIIGYAGSLRNNRNAFVALDQFLQQNPDWFLLILGTEIPAPLKGDKYADRLIYQPYENYHNYARRMARLRPDILIAPLDETIFSMSKCPNKFFEITAAGAVGVFSEIPPYRGVVEDNKNGLVIPLAQNTNAKAWLERLTSLAHQPDLRKKLHREAMALVLNKFNTDINYSEFKDLMTSFLKRKHQTFHHPAVDDKCQ